MVGRRRTLGNGYDCDDIMTALHDTLSPRMGHSEQSIMLDPFSSGGTQFNSTLVLTLPTNLHPSLQPLYMISRTLAFLLAYTFFGHNTYTSDYLVDYNTQRELHANVS